MLPRAVTFPTGAGKGWCEWLVPRVRADVIERLGL